MQKKLFAKNLFLSLLIIIFTNILSAQSMVSALVYTEEQGWIDELQLQINCQLDQKIYPVHTTQGIKYYHSISTPEELQAISKNPSANYILCDNIDMNEFAGEFKPIGQVKEEFTGVLNGNKKAIKNLKVSIDGNGTGFKYAGLFAFMHGQVSQLSLENVDISSKYYFSFVGGLAAIARGEIHHVSVSGQVRSQYSGVGGIVGQDKGSRFHSNLVFSGRVKGHALVGGLFGQIWGSEHKRTLVTDSFVKNSLIEGQVSARLDGGVVGGAFSVISNSDIKRVYVENTHVRGGKKESLVDAVGGLVARANSSTIELSYVDADSSVWGAKSVGGFLGEATARTSITNSYTHADVTATKTDAAGFIASISVDTHVSNVYATGKVASLDKASGLIVRLFRGSTISDSYWDRETTGQETSAGGEGARKKTTEQMQDPETFSKWDKTIWNLRKGFYPSLRWQNHDLKN